MNVLASSLALLNRIETYSFSSLSELAYSKIVSISAEDIFSFSTSCGWVSENENALILTKHALDSCGYRHRDYSLTLSGKCLQIMY